MESLFNNSYVMIYFFTIVTIFNYERLEEEQSIGIMYILLYSMLFLNPKTISLGMAVALLLASMFCVVEFLTQDKDKYILLGNPLYKLVDCLLRAFTQFHLLWILLAYLCLAGSHHLFDGGTTIRHIGVAVSMILLLVGINDMLKQKFRIAPVGDMLQVFKQYPINEFSLDKVNLHGFGILVALEDDTYWERESDTYLSEAMVRHVLSKRLGPWAPSRERRREMWHLVKSFVINTLHHKRGYSTLQMQLVRSVGVESGYNCAVRRKIFELVYTPMFMRSLRYYYEVHKYAHREEWKRYLLYIYMLSVNTFLGEDIRFQHFYKAFDFHGTHKGDLSGWSDEGIFIACLGLNKRTKNLNPETVDYYMSLVPVTLDRDTILEMSRDYAGNPDRYNGEYLK